MRKLALPIALIFAFAMVGCSDEDPDCIDVDGDGYGVGPDCLGLDCNDNDDAVWEDIDGYLDADDDGEYSENVTTVCTDGTLPDNYSDTAGTDCDDGDAQAIEMVPAYIDLDGDGYGGGSEVQVCGDTGYLPPDYAEVGGDCDDASEIIFTEWTGYADWDEDGVATDVASTLCGTDIMPEGYLDTAGTDCDDIDPFATNDASHGAMCSYGGTCGDTEMLILGQPDMMGIGACVSVDCNGDDPACASPLTDTTNTCVDVNDCNVGELCFDPSGGTALTCWSIPGCCNNVPAGLYCSEIIACLSACASHLPDYVAYVRCQQEDCFEAARPKAQHLYRVAAECAAENDCWAEQPGGADAIQACVVDNCMSVFTLCLADPAP